MKTKKLIRYAVPVSRYFPSTHVRKGDKTEFVDSIYFGKKLHTIRNNKNNVWTKRMKKVLEGKAVIDLFYWKLPGGRWTKDNEQIVFARLDKNSGCGVQELIFGYDPTTFSECIDYPIILNHDKKSFDLDLKTDVIAKNDGLSLEDFKSWFKGYELSEPLAIIHFTKFRY